MLCSWELLQPLYPELRQEVHQRQGPLLRAGAWTKHLDRGPEASPGDARTGEFGSAHAILELRNLAIRTVGDLPPACLQPWVDAAHNGLKR